VNHEARRDHRDINQDLPVFATDPLAGAGLPLWLPDGAVIREELQRLARDIARADGCQSVYSPVLGKRALFVRSGHWEKFSDDMFPLMPVGGDELVLRPANCPHHALIYSSAQRSYRDLPVRLNELAAMFRAERSGVLSGLSRVRQINLDDTHVFCRPDQVAAEAARALRLPRRWSLPPRRRPPEAGRGYGRGPRRDRVGKGAIARMRFPDARTAAIFTLWPASASSSLAGPGVAPPDPRAESG
jgi:threonyl-tRNA synthetase